MTQNQIKMNELALKQKQLEEESRHNRETENELYRSHKEQEAIKIGENSGKNPFSLIGYFGRHTRDDSKPVTPFNDLHDFAGATSLGETGKKVKSIVYDNLSNLLF